MTANSPTRTSHSLGADLLLVAFLVGLIVAGRLLPHLPNFNPVVAAALFAGATLSRRWLALAVPVLGMLISDQFIMRDFAAVTAVVYAALRSIDRQSQAVRIADIIAESHKKLAEGSRNVA